MATLGFVAGIESAGTKAWGALKDLGGAARTGYEGVTTHIGGKLEAADKMVAGHITTNKGDVGKAVAGIAKKHPVSSVVAATAVAGGALYAGNQVFGKHTKYVVDRRASESQQRQY